MDIKDLPLDDLTPATLWVALDPETREEAARAAYADKEARREADAAVAAALRFREVALRKLPVEQRISHLLRRVHPDDGLAGTLLVALHLQHRRPLLETFLSALEIPHDGGVIEPSHELQQRDEATLQTAVDRLDERFERTEVDLYLAALLAMDPEPWSGLAAVLRGRA